MNRGILALDDFVSFDDAIGMGRSLTSDMDTMIVATADHSHTFTFGGDSLRGNPILGKLNVLSILYICDLSK